MFSGDNVKLCKLFCVGKMLGFKHEVVTSGCNNIFKYSSGQQTFFAGIPLGTYFL